MIDPKELVALRQWHEDRMTFAEDRAHRAMSLECKEANKTTAYMHRKTIEALRLVKL